MIKANKKEVKLKGFGPDLLDEYAKVTRSLIATFQEQGISKEFALDMVAEAHRVGTLTEQELEEETRKIVGKIMMDIANSMCGNSEESEETEDAE